MVSADRPDRFECSKHSEGRRFRQLESLYELRHDQWDAGGREFIQDSERCSNARSARESVASCFSDLHQRCHHYLSRLPGRSLRQFARPVLTCTHGECQALINKMELISLYGT